jgi:hypothetical protein
MATGSALSLHIPICGVAKMKLHHDILMSIVSDVAVKRQ